MRKVYVRGAAPVMSPDEVLTRAAGLAAALEQEPVDAVYLFGSYGRAVKGQGSVSPLSDVDLGIQVADGVAEHDYGALLLRLLGLLSSLFGRDDLDVTLLNQAGATLRYEAIPRGHPLFLRRPGLDLELKVSARREYLDTARMREFYHRSYVNRIKGGTEP